MAPPPPLVVEIYTKSLSQQPINLERSVKVTKELSQWMGLNEMVYCSAITTYKGVNLYLRSISATSEKMFLCQNNF